MTEGGRVSSVGQEPTRGMHVPGGRPSCYCTGNPPWPCGAAETPDLWAALTTHSPGCAGCAKSRLAQDLYWGLAE